MNKFLITGYCVLVFATDCSLLPQDYTKIVGKNSEVIVNPITQFYSKVERGDQLNLTDENQKLTLVAPIEMTYEFEFPQQPPLSNFITISVYTDDNYEWLNKYQILGIKNEYVLMSTYSFRPGMQSRTPLFNSYHTLEDPKQVTYYSSSILDSNHILIDCSTNDDQGVQSHYFYLIDESANTKTKIPNNYPYQNQQRQIQSTDQFVYRGTSATTSIIEIFQYDLQENKVNLWTTIDEQFVASYVNNTEYQFQLVEFKIGKNDEIIILDKYGNILFFQYAQIEETFSFKYIAQNLGESHNFNFDFLNSHYAVIQKNKLLSNFHNEQQFYITVDDLTGFRVHLANHFVYLTAPTKIMSFDQSLSLIAVQEGDFSQTLSDFKQNDLFTFNSLSIKHYQLQHDYTIKYVNHDAEVGSATLKLNGCSVTIDYQNVDNNYAGLIQISKGQLVDSPFFTYQTNQAQYPRHLVDGPEIKLEISETKSDNLSYVGDQTYTDKNIQSQDTIFVHVISQDFDFTSNRPYYIVTQNKDKLLTIYYCQLFLQQNCSVYATHQLTMELNNENIKLLHIEDSLDRSIYVAVLVSLNKLTIHQFTQSGEHHEKSYLSEYEIDNFSFTKISDDNLLVLYSLRLQSLRVYLFSTMKILYNITPEKIKELGITNWNPQKIFANDYELWTFIVNGDKEIIILNLQINAFSIISILSIQASKDLRIMIFQDRFGVIQLFESGKVQLQIFNKKQETNIYLEKKPSFYSYKVNSLDYLNYFSYHGVLNIKAINQQGEAVVLTYLIDKTDHNMLHSVIDVESTFKFIRSITNKIFIFYPEYVQIVEFQVNPQIVAKSVKFDDNTFVSDIESKLIYSNFFANVELNQTFRLANTYQQVKINKDNLNVTFNLSSNKYDNYKKDMGTLWYSGFVSLFELTVNENANAFNVISPLQQIKQDYQSDSLNVADLDKDYILVLKQKEIVLMNKQTNLKEKSYSFVENLLCSNILTQEKGNLILLCQYKDKQVIQGLQCTGITCKIGQSWMEKKENIVKAQILGDIIFLVLQLKVEVYIGSILDFDHVTLCEIEDYSHSSQLIQAITIQQVYQQIYQIYYIDYNNQLTIRQYLLANNQFLQKNNSTIDLKEFINQDYYILKHMQFQYISIMNIQQSESQFQADFIFYSDIGPHYCIFLDFIKENDDIFNLKSKQIKFIIQGYGQYRLSAKAFPFIVINSDYIIIPYVSGNIILTVYQIPKSQSLNQSIQFLGLIQVKSSNIQFLSYSTQNQVKFIYFQAYLLSNINDQLALYQINNSPQLVINGSISSTQGQLMISNDFTSDIIQININVPDSEDDDKNGHTALWIIIGILGGIAVFGVAFYFYKKKKQKVETFIVN